jgi:hypothetical protein
MKVALVCEENNFELRKNIIELLRLMLYIVDLLFPAHGKYRSNVREIYVLHVGDREPINI